MCQEKSFLFEHNREVYEQLENYLSVDNKAIVVLGTGIGKTTTALEYLNNHQVRGLVICPQNAIRADWDKVDEYVDTITYSKFAKVYQDIDYSNYGAVICDEVHHVGADKWGAGIKHIIDNDLCKVIGLTATPDRTDKIDIVNNIFSGNICQGLDMLAGIKEGIVHPFTYVGAYYDTDGLKEENENEERRKEDKEYDLLCGKLDLAINNTPSLNEIITSNMPEGDRKIIVFVSDIDSIPEAKQILKPIFPNLEHRSLHSGLSKEEIEENREWFKNTNEGLLYTINMASEGIHYIGVNTLIMFRRTCSNIVFTQQMGRISTLTKYENPNAIVFDLVNNAKTVGNFKMAIKELSKEYSPREIRDILREHSTNEKSNQIIVRDYTGDIVDVLEEMREYDSNRWTEEEVQILKECAFHQTWEELAKCLGHPIEGVKSKAYELGLRKGINVLSEEILTDIDGMIRCGCTFEEIHNTFPFIDKNYFTYRKRKIFGATLSRKPITEYEKTIILNEYPTKGREILSLLPGRNVEWLQSTASRLGVKLNPVWTSDMDNVIKEKYAEVGAKGIHRIMPEKSVSQIADRAIKLGVKFDSNWWSKEEDEVLKNFWVHDRERALQLLPKRTFKNCQQRAIKMRLLQEGYCWTDEEIVTLKKYYAIGGKYEVKKHLTTKSISQIASKASALKLKSPNHKKRIKCIETNEVYESASEAMRQTGIKTIDMCARGKCKTAGGYHWEYVEEENEKLNKTEE